MRIVIQPQQPFNPLDSNLTGAEYIQQYSQYLDQQINQSMQVPITEAFGWPDWMGWLATFQPSPFHFIVGGALLFLVGLFMVRVYPKFIESVKTDDRAAGWVFVVALGLIFGLGLIWL